MAGVFDKFAGFFRFSENDYDEDEYEEEEAEQETAAAAAREKEQRSERVSERKVEKSTSRQQNNGYTEVPTRRIRQTGESSVTNIVPIRTTSSGLEVCIMKPHSFGDSDKLCEALLSGHAVVINLEGLDTEQAQRIIDFVSGAVFAIEGKLYQISRYIFICSPGNVDISQDMEDISQNVSSIGATIDKEF